VRNVQDTEACILRGDAGGGRLQGERFQRGGQLPVRRDASRGKLAFPPLDLPKRGLRRPLLGAAGPVIAYNANNNMTWRLQDGVAYEQA